MGTELKPYVPKVNIIDDIEGRKIVFINDIRFKSRRGIDWTLIERILKEYIGKYYQIIDSSEKIYIGSDFPDEFCHSVDTYKTVGSNKKAKANIVSALKEIVEVASDKKEYPNYNEKHKSTAKFGWYRYDTRFAIPIYNEFDEVAQYNIYKARMVVRRDRNGKLYLYDFVRIKKETSDPPR